MHVLASLSLNPEHIIRSFGTIGLIAIIFAESGLLVGFFLPGDSLLFTAGLLASQGRLNLAVVLIGCFLAAFIGDQVGYAFGKKAGPSIFKRPDSRWFKHENVERAEEFFEHHGSKTIILARFVPVVRTFAPIVAGVSSMRYRTFVMYNLIGAFLWAVGVTLLGYWLGNTIPNIDKYLLPIIFGIIVVSLIPVFVEYRRQKNKAARPPERTSPSIDESRDG